MPAMNGDESPIQLRRVDPDVPILLSSGYNQVDIIRRVKPQNIAGFIQKPFTIKQLNTAVEKALDEAAQSAQS
jgi:FixJ family two-component response regulator